MNLGGGSVVDMDFNTSEKHQIADASRGHATATAYSSSGPGHHSWASPTGPVTVSWNMYKTDNGPIGNGVPQGSGYHYDPQWETAISKDAQDGRKDASQPATSSSLQTANATQDYYGYAYSNSTDPYGYKYGEYQSYNGYQQLSTDSSSQQVGASQNSGAPYQPLSSFQNSASYVGPTSYSATYYNAGDHQTTSQFQGGSYNNQTNLWSDGNHGSYPPHLYPNYASSNSSSSQSASVVPANTYHYEHQYNQWADYYNHTPSSFSCPPGTGNISAITSPVGCPVPGAAGGYPYTYSNNQPPPPGTTSWRGDAGSSGLPLQGKNDASGYILNDGREAAPAGLQNHLVNQVPPYAQKPSDSNPHSHDQQKTIYSPGLNSQFSSTNQVAENFQPPLQTVPMMDTRRISKIQIPTNPRIAPALPLGMPKVDKENLTSNATLKPAYIGVSVPKPNSNVSSHGDAESIIKGTFPIPLRSYVERTFARCKDDAQRSANQAIMKEIITKASADGTLFTKNWDLEPLFPLSNTTETIDHNNTLISVAASSLPKPKRSPSRRTKSRWEPVPEEKLPEKFASVSYESTKLVVDKRKFGTNVNDWKSVKFVSSQEQSLSSKIVQRPVKKQKLSESLNVIENGDVSSDSDKEQGLTKYYSSAIALADSPEEKRRREHRFKRFEKVQERRPDIKPYGLQVSGAGNLYMKKANALMLGKDYDNSCSKAVEDIDWDALTVKGTCQEVEKRYLRLTSAPDPATVRPEDVLEKALQMVKTSEKNYLYKCDQLKSIRQDLTVQRIQNELTVKVYETHARLALGSGDLPEYNQCQSQLKRLYAEGIKGCYMEFSAYNLLCVILHSNNTRDLVSSMSSLSPEAKEDEAVKHALGVRRAVSSGNYIQFFKLYKTAPNLNTCLMDLYLEKMRFEAVKCMSKAYRPTVPVSHIARVIGFTSKDRRHECQVENADGIQECEEWLRTHGAVISVDNNGEKLLDTKATVSSLYMPEPDDAVAHGDANLAVDDFLTRTS